MKKLAEMILSLLDLLEAEGYLLRIRTLDTIRDGALLFLGIMLLGAAVAFFLAALYYTLIIFISTPLALCALGIISLGIALLLLCLPYKKKKK